MTTQTVSFGELIELADELGLDLDDVLQVANAHAQPWVGRAEGVHLSIERSALEPDKFVVKLY